MSEMLYSTSVIAVSIFLCACLSAVNAVPCNDQGWEFIVCGFTMPSRWWGGGGGGGGLSQEL